MRPPLSLAVLALASSATAQDVRLELWTNGTWPGGLPITSTTGASWADLDGDGWSDFFGTKIGELWLNQRGQNWVVHTGLLPQVNRYGCSIADYDNDGLADIATEPRKVTNEKMILLHNQGAPVFVDVGSDPSIVDVPPMGDSETNAWCDVDFDGNLDLFIPVYPPWAMGGGRGNFFLHNQGPTGPGGAYRFFEKSAVAGLDNPPGTSRPEGVEFCDIDGDGDIDLFSNATLYQNRSTLGVPFFMDLSEAASGLGNRDILDEGASFFDYDMDGDFDLLILWCSPKWRTRVVENKGDGIFDIQPKSLIANNSSNCIYMSKADWDNDGDIDITTNVDFRRNTLVETGQRGFVDATHNLPAADLANAPFAWADWDKDGDLDLLVNTFNDNKLYEPGTPRAERRFVRVQVVNDSDTVERGLETEFGASVEIFVHEDGTGLRRRSFVTSSGGYINQNEYGVHFGLPRDPVPADPTRDLHFDLRVDYNSDPAVGLRRVDRHVNPILGNIHLADLIDREIVVYRSGKVVLDGCTYLPALGNAPDTLTSTSGLVLTDNALPLQPPVLAPGTEWYVGLAFDTSLALGPTLLKEIVVDGAIAKTSPSCSGGRAKLVLWDTTDLANPFIVPGGAMDAERQARNDRTTYRTNLRLEPGRQFRLVARVSHLRPTPINAPEVDGNLTVHGGLSFLDMSPCDGIALTAATVDPSQVYVAVRFAEDSGALWADLGVALPGTGGTATLSGVGSVEPGTQVTLVLAGAPASTATILVIGSDALCKPMAGGILFPSMDTLVPLTTDAAGSWSWPMNIPAGQPAGTSLYFQVWWSDSTAVRGRAASNALSATTPF